MATRIKSKTLAAVPQSKNDCAESIRLIGDLQRELWFADGKLVHVRFQAEDGSQIDYVLR